MSRYLRWRTGGAAAAAIVALAACSLPPDAAPRELASEDVPFGLLDPSPTTTTPATSATEPAAVVPVYLLGPADQLVSVPRTTGSATPSGALRALLQDISTVESATGLRTAIPEGTSILGLHEGPEPGAVVVDLSDEFLSVQGEQQIKAVGQVVLTLTGLPSVSGVRFAFEGEIRPVFRGDGELTDAPLTRFSFSQLTAPTTTTTTTAAPPRGGD